MNCAQCGSTVDWTQRYCASCGASVDGAGLRDAESGLTDQHTAIVAPPSTPHASPSAEQSGPGLSRGAIVAAASAAIVAVSALAVVLVLSGRDPTTTVAGSNSSTEPVVSSTTTPATTTSDSAPMLSPKLVVRRGKTPQNPGSSIDYVVTEKSRRSLNSVRLFVNDEQVDSGVGKRSTLTWTPEVDGDYRLAVMAQIDGVEVAKWEGVAAVRYPGATQTALDVAREYADALDRMDLAAVNVLRKPDLKWAGSVEATMGGYADIDGSQLYLTSASQTSSDIYGLQLAYVVHQTVDPRENVGPTFTSFYCAAWTVDVQTGEVTVGKFRLIENRPHFDWTKNKYTAATGSPPTVHVPFASYISRRNECA